MKRKAALVLCLILCLAGCSFAQEAGIFPPDQIKKEIIAIPISSDLHIDGVLDEAEWALPAPSPRFVQIEPYQGAAPNFETDLRVLYNRKFLYFGIVSHDSLGKKAIRATDFKRDFNFMQHDLVTLSFDGFNDERNAMSLAVNAYGVQRDLLAFDDLYYDVDWDGLWSVRTTRTDTGWVAEIAVPWQTLRYPKTTDTLQNWAFNIYRNRRLTNEITALSPFPRAFSSLRMAYAGVLKNLQPPPPKTNIRVQPYLLTSYDRFQGYPTNVKPEDTKLKVGGDLKWAISPNAVLDLTANTDFAQADVDRQVNNVTRFSVFYPERRQFFLENASLFGVGVSQAGDLSGGSMRIQPFFSRSIGLNDAGNPIPLDAGGRFVYRSGQRNFGAMAMRQRELDDSPGTNFFVGRYSENIGKENRIGVLMTAKNRPDSTNIVTALDGFLRIGKSSSLNLMGIHSTTTDGGKQGLSGFAQYYYSNNRWKIWWTETVVTKDFNPAMGFVSRSDVIGTTPGIYRYIRGDKLPFKKWLRAFEPSVFAEIYHQASTGKLIEQNWGCYPFYLNLQSGAYFGYGFYLVEQHLIAPFEPLGVLIQTGKYNYFQHQIIGSTDPSKILNLMVLYTWGEYFNGKLNSGDWTLQFAPVPHFSLSARFNRNHFKKVGEPVTTTTIDLYSLEGRFALNPRLQLIGFYQKNGENSSSNYNIRLSWEYRPLSYIYFVYNHRTFDLLQNETMREDHGIAKVSYLKQF